MKRFLPIWCEIHFRHVAGIHCRHMVVKEFSNAEFVRKMQHRNLEEGLGRVWEQPNKTAEKMLLDLKCCLGQFGSVNKFL